MADKQVKRLARERIVEEASQKDAASESKLSEAKIAALHLSTGLPLSRVRALYAPAFAERAARLSPLSPGASFPILPQKVQEQELSGLLGFHAERAASGRRVHKPELQKIAEQFHLPHKDILRQFEILRAEALQRHGVPLPPRPLEQVRTVPRLFDLMKFLAERRAAGQMVAMERFLQVARKHGVAPGQAREAFETLVAEAKAARKRTARARQLATMLERERAKPSSPAERRARVKTLELQEVRKNPAFMRYLELLLEQDEQGLRRITRSKLGNAASRFKLPGKAAWTVFQEESLKRRNR